MRAIAVASLVVSGLAPCAASDSSGASNALVVVENSSAIDVAFDFSVGGRRVPGCFWVLHGRSTTFALPPGKVAWSYSLAGAQYTGELRLSVAQPKMLQCQAAQARMGEEIAKCEPSAAPKTLPPHDSIAALAGVTLGFLDELGQKLAKEDANALGALIQPPFDVEWAGDKPGKRRVKNARHLLEVRSHLDLDANALAAAKTHGDDPRTGEDDCEKHAVDWSKGNSALACDGRSVSVTLRPSAACGASRGMGSWKLDNPSASWLFAGKRHEDPPAQP